jgi:hypothetical protein
MWHPAQSGDQVGTMLAGMATILLLITAVLAVTSAVCMVWIRVAAADHRQRWTFPDHSRLEPFHGAG